VATRRKREDASTGGDYFTEMCSGSVTGSYLRLIYFVYHSTLGLRVIKRERGESHLAAHDQALFDRAHLPGWREHRLWERREIEFFIDNLLVRIHFIIAMIKWTGLAPLEFEFPFPGSLTSTFLVGKSTVYGKGESTARCRIVKMERACSHHICAPEKTKTELGVGVWGLGFGVWGVGFTAVERLLQM